MELYLEGAEVHVFIMEVSTFCQFGKMAFGEVKSEKHTDSLASRHTLLQKNNILKKDKNEGKRWKKPKRERDAVTLSYGDNRVCVCVCTGVFACMRTHFFTFLTFILAVLLLQERMRGSALSSGISALLA